MRTRGRKSAAALSTPVAYGSHGVQITPPTGLSPEAERLFFEFLDVTEPGHFNQADAHLLGTLCETVALVRHASSKLKDDPSWITAWERAVRSQASLSTKLRLTPQSRGPGRADPGRQLNYSEKVCLGIIKP